MLVASQTYIDSTQVSEVKVDARVSWPEETKQSHVSVAHGQNFPRYFYFLFFKCRGVSLERDMPMASLVSPQDVLEYQLPLIDAWSMCQRWE